MSDTPSKTGRPGVVNSYIKAALTRLGRRLSPRHIYACQAAANYIRLGGWMREHGFMFEHRLASRFAVFDFLAARVRDIRVLYLEFGVHHGESIRHFASRLRHPDTRLHGFDSFEGLPAAWGPYERGFFDVKGRIPAIEDHRVQFFKGWFEDTLPTYEPSRHDVLVLMIDADIYSSIVYVLTRVQPWVQRGTLMILDDMNFVDHAPRAFSEFMEASGLRFRPVCAERTLACVAFECLGS